MKQILLNILFLVPLCFAGMAQTRPQQSMYMFNYTMLNPAATGIEDYAQARTGLRRQWVGIDGAPTTTWLNGEMRTGKGGTNEGTVISKGNGIGFNLYHDKVGPYAITNLNFGYAYHLLLSDVLSLSAGFSGGVQQTRFDMSKSIYPDQGTDPAAVNESDISKKLSPDLNAGLLLNGKRFFAGVSVMQLMRSKFLKGDESESTLQQQMLISIGYMYPIDEEGSGFWLSGIYKSDFNNPARYDLNVKVRYQNIFWAGASCRFNDAFGLGLGLDITHNLTAGYLYEWGIDKHISSYSKGSHEFYIGFKFLKDKQRGRQRMGW